MLQPWCVCVRACPQLLRLLGHPVISHGGTGDFAQLTGEVVTQTHGGQVNAHAHTHTYACGVGGAPASICPARRLQL